ncbi:hypothetical protein [Streptomyces candidus]|uniref:Uncharacterized protein n=1 Tax=Streptomyces candidus TaxID=67283 RepID=A0A7X0LT01_9ACTN|nr:hypothetical protein [Streptomyces candidus]MBB6439722.1 hypothetical protein [Streptomyces candidus]GHH45863.1 hypothetical protein GCM10018773_36160 [Streptomyces candidus]
MTISAFAPTTVPEAVALPPVEVALPGWQLTASLARRWQTSAGAWVYRVAVRAWTADHSRTGQDLAESLVEIAIPADHVRPVPGQDYRTVPSLHRAAGGTIGERPRGMRGQPQSVEGWQVESVRQGRRRRLAMCVLPAMRAVI